MLSILKKDIISFFSNTSGYLIILTFLIANNLVLWSLKTEYNIFNNGYADLSLFFKTTPLFLLVLSSILSMKSFSEEIKHGTIELLFTKPISKLELVLGKLLAVITLLVVTLIPSLFYIFILNSLTDTPELIDLNTIFSSYLGLIFLVFSFSSVGVFCSSLTKNQVIALLYSILICLVLYYGLDYIKLNKFSALNNYNNFTKGILDTRGIIYFSSVSVLFLVFTTFNLKQLSK